MAKPYIEYEILPNGNLVFRATNEARHDYAQQLRERGSDSVFWDVLAPFQANGILFGIDPEDIGALTSAPIITDDLTIEDDGERTVHGKVWWFPNYCIIDPMAELFHKGRVEFTLAT